MSTENELKIAFACMYGSGAKKVDQKKTVKKAVKKTVKKTAEPIAAEAVTKVEDLAAAVVVGG